MSSPSYPKDLDVYPTVRLDLFLIVCAEFCNLRSFKLPIRDIGILDRNINMFEKILIHEGSIRLRGRWLQRIVLIKIESDDILEA